MEKKKILIIEDEVNIARFLELELNHEGYEAHIAHDGREGLEKSIENPYDLIILDVMLPSLSGMEVLRRMRQKVDTPVIMLTAKDEITDKIMGLDIGADDYMTKPFAIEELLARIRVIFKRLGNNDVKDVSQNSVLKVKEITLDCEGYIVKYKNEIIELTKKEFELLKYLLINKNIVLTRDKILETVWGYEFIGDTNVVDVYVRYLRCKIDDKYNLKLIHIVRGVGYQIKDE